MTHNQDLEDLFVESGLTDFKWLNPIDITVAHWVRMKCTYGCSDYGRAGCPPNTPSIPECRAFIKEYSCAVAFHFRFEAEKGNYPMNYSNELDAKIVELEKKVFLQGYVKAFAFTQNCCVLCKDCAKTKAECKFPEKSRPSPESFGIDLYSTMRNIGYSLEVVTKSHQPIDRYALLLVE